MTGNDSGNLGRRAAETKARQIWKDVLKMPDGQDGATFFELDGQSISAIQIVARVEEELGVWIDVGDLFEDPDLDTFVRDVVAKVGGSSALTR